MYVPGGLAMESGKFDPPVSAELAQAVTRLGYLRQQLKELETEEALLRQRIIDEVGHWPSDAFPVKVGRFEVRLSYRKGRVDAAAAEAVLKAQRLMSEIPLTAHIADIPAMDELGRGLASLPMPDDTRSALIVRYQTAVDWIPDMSADTIGALYERARLTPEQYQRCFKDGKATTLSLAVR